MLPDATLAALEEKIAGMIDAGRNARRPPGLTEALPRLCTRRGGGVPVVLP